MEFRLGEGSVTTPAGFRAGATICGLKQKEGRKDCGLLVSDVPCAAAGTFTTNRAKAAPVVVSMRHLANGRAQAVAFNSGNANASTGEQGLRDAAQMASLAGEKLGIPADDVLVASTGIIGVPIDMTKVARGIAQVEPVRDGGLDLAHAMMTTDTRPKTVAVTFELEGQTVTIGGNAKGAGMIYPNMATMICLITTDAAVDAGFLRETLHDAVQDSFNMICIDGDMSTNDTVVVLANGLAGNATIDATAAGAGIFTAALRAVCTFLAKEIVRDGEGATKIIEVRVKGAETAADARQIARAITLSPLVKAAVAGEDPNWGRIMSTVGATPNVTVDCAKVDIDMGPVALVRGGLRAGYDERDGHDAMTGKEVYVTVDLHQGPHGATAWGCDLTEEYVFENRAYRT